MFDLPKSLTRETPPEGEPLLWLWAESRHITPGDFYEGYPRDGSKNYEKIFAKLPSHWLPWPKWWPKKGEIRIENEDPLGLLPEDDTKKENPTGEQGIVWEVEVIGGEAFPFARGQTITINWEDTPTNAGHADTSFKGVAIFKRHILHMSRRTHSKFPPKTPLVEAETPYGEKLLVPLSCVENFTLATHSPFKEGDRVSVTWKDEGAESGSWADNSYYGEATFLRLVKKEDPDGALLEKEPHAYVFVSEDTPNRVFPLASLCTPREPVVEIDSVKGSCPVIAKGRIEHLPFFFRAMDSKWSLGIGKTDPEKNPEVSFEQPYPNAGWMRKAEARQIIKETAQTFYDSQRQRKTPPL
jgi:hypothetical protein